MTRLFTAAILAVSLSGCGSMMGGPSISPAFFDGYNAHKRGDYASAERFLGAALSADPNDPYSNLAMGSVMHQTGRADLAAKHYQAAIANGEQTFGARIYEARPNNENFFQNGASASIADLARQNLALLAAR